MAINNCPTCGGDGYLAVTLTNSNSCWCDWATPQLGPMLFCEVNLLSFACGQLHSATHQFGYLADHLKPCGFLRNPPSTRQEDVSVESHLKLFRRCINSIIPATVGCVDDRQVRVQYRFSVNDLGPTNSANHNRWVIRSSRIIPPSPPHRIWIGLTSRIG